MFNTAYEWNDFKATIRDLLISMKAFACPDNAFYEEERQVSKQFSLMIFSDCFG